MLFECSVEEHDTRCGEKLISACALRSLKECTPKRCQWCAAPTPPHLAENTPQKIPRTLQVISAKTLDFAMDGQGGGAGARNSGEKGASGNHLRFPECWGNRPVGTGLPRRSATSAFAAGAPAPPPGPAPSICEKPFDGMEVQMNSRSGSSPAPS